MNIKTNFPVTTVSGSYGFTGSSTTSGTASIIGTTTTTAYGLTGSSGLSFVGYHSVVSKVKYYVLGKEIEVEGYKDATTALYISLVNIHGKAFYDEVKKQGVDFPKQIDDYLKVNLVSWERNKKLDTLL